MDKDEILQKSRKLKEDEGVTFVENKGRRAGVMGFTAFFMLFMIFNSLTGQKNFVPLSMFFAYLSAEAFGKYRMVKTRAYLATTLLAAVAAICFFVCHALVVLGVGA